MIYGIELPRTDWEERHDPCRDVIGAVERSASGNVVLRVGRENEPEGPWHQLAHVVLTPNEARGLCEQIDRQLGEG